MSILNKKPASVPSMAAFVMTFFLFTPAGSARAEAPPTLKESGIEGKATLGGDSGKAEAMLLGARALKSIASSFAAQIKRDLPNASELLIFPSTHQFDFNELRTFNSAYDRLASQAWRKSERRLPDKGLNEGVMASTGLAVEFAKSLLSYFKTDYSFGSVAIELPDQMLRNALAHTLRQHYKGDITILMPGLFQPLNDTLPVELTQKLDDISTWAKSSVEAQNLLKELLASDPNHQQQPLLQTVIAQYELYELIRNDRNQNRYIVYLGPDSLSGSMYTKKSLWSSLGSNPFHVMGSAVASYAVVDGCTGNVVSAMLQPLHGGYHSVSKIERLVNRPEQ